MWHSKGSKCVKLVSALSDFPHTAPAVPHCVRSALLVGAVRLSKPGEWGWEDYGEEQRGSTNVGEWREAGTHITAQALL